MRFCHVTHPVFILLLNHVPPFIPPNRRTRYRSLARQLAGKRTPYAESLGGNAVGTPPAVSGGAVADRDSLKQERWVQNDALQEWVLRVAAYTRPDRIHYCDGSEAERDTLMATMCSDGSLVPLPEETHPRSYLHRSNPNDVARTEHLTFISTSERQAAGPTNNWMSPSEAESRVWPLFSGCMKGRTMYVVPYLMGPAGSRFSRVGVQVTDSPYVVANLRIMTRMGNAAMAAIHDGLEFVRGIHSLGDLSPERRYIVHFPENATIWSIGSGYGGNALLSKKCHALRIASVQARKEGWLAEHMLIVGVTNPQGVKHYIAAAFPSACGKTNLAMLVPTLPGWTIETVGDDICWMHIGEDGRLWAINPEAGMFGVLNFLHTRS